MHHRVMVNDSTETDPQGSDVTTFVKPLLRVCRHTLLDTLAQSILFFFSHDTPVTYDFWKESVSFKPE